MSLGCRDMKSDFLSTKVYQIVREKGDEFKQIGIFSRDSWYAYLRSAGCEPMKMFGERDWAFPDLTVKDDDIIIVDDHTFELSNSMKWQRLLLVDGQTAMKIATLGLP